MSKTKRLKVKGLPPEVTEDQLVLLFQNKRRQGGGPVQMVELNKEARSAIVTFEKTEAVDTILKRGKTVDIDGEKVTLTRLVSRKSTPLDERSGSDSELSQSSEPHSSEKSRRQLRDLPENLGKKKDSGSKKEVTIQWKKSLRSSKSSVSHDNTGSKYEAVSETEDLQDLVQRTIKAKVKDVTRSKDSYFYYLTDPNVSDGEFDEDSMVLDGLRGYLYVTFHNDKDVRAICRLPHSEDSNFLSMEVATEEDFNIYNNLLSVHTQGFQFDSEDKLNELAYFVKVITDLELVDIHCYDEPRSLILEFPQEMLEGPANINEIAWMISTEEFCGIHLITAPVFKSNKVMVSDLKQTTTEEMLVRYFSHSRSGGEPGVVDSTVEWLGPNAILTFKFEECVKNVLSKTSHRLEGRELKVCYFHPCLTSNMYEEYIEHRQQALQTHVAEAKSKKGSSTPRKGGSSNYIEASEDDYSEDESTRNEDKNELGDKESKHQPITREEFKIDEMYELELLRQISYEKYLEENFNVRLTINFYDKLCILEGPQDVMRMANIEVLKKTQEFRQMVIGPLNVEQMELLSTEKVQMKIKEKWKKKTIAAYLQHKGDRVVVHYVPMPGYNEKVIGQVVKNQVIMETKSLETDDALAVFLSPKGQEFLSELNETHSDYQANARVRLHAEEKSLVFVAPFKRLHEIQSEIDRFIKEYKLDDAEVDASREKQEYIDKFNKSELDDIISSLGKMATRVQFKPSTGKIYVKGPKEGVSHGERSLSALYNKVTAEKFAVSLLGIKTFLGCPDGKDIWQRTERNHSCMLKYASNQGSKPDDHGKSSFSASFRGGRTTMKDVADSCCPVNNAKYISDDDKISGSSNQGKDSSGGKNFGRIFVHVVEGEISKAKADVVVSSVDKSLDMSKFRMSKAVLEQAGQSVQQELMTKYPKGVRQGDFVKTSGGSLQCRHVFHACLPSWDTGREAQLSKLVVKMLEEADQLKAKSVAIPALGTGGLKYPADVSANSITDAICQFAKDHRNSSVTSVNLVIFPGSRDVQTFKAVTATSERSSRETPGQQKGPESGPAPGPGPGPGNTFSFGSVTLTVKKGDITNERCDAIVNGIKVDMDLSSSGAVCKSLLQKCGSALQDDCKSQADEMSKNGLAVTAGHGLACKHIIHLNNEKFGYHKIEQGVKLALDAAESCGLRSLALPAIGTARKDADINRIKEMIFGAVKKFGSSGSHNLQDIRLVIFSQNILNAFLEQGHQGRDSKHFSSKDPGPSSATYDGSNQPDRVDLIVYSNSGRSCEAAKKAMIRACSEKYIKTSEEEPTLKHFHLSQIKELEAIGLKHQVHVAVKGDKGVVAIEGFSSMEALLEVQQKLREFTKATYEYRHQTAMKQIKAVPTAIQWQFKKGDEWKDFEPIANSQLEREYQNKSKSCDITDSEGRKYHIDFENLKETRAGKNKAVLDIQRLDRTGTKEEPLPKHWDPMPTKDNLMLVLLKSDSTEYKTVETKFHAAGANVPIKQIQRVQNKALYQQYAVKKREIEARNPQGHQNELILYHGTNATNINAMNQNGFNRNYSGANATVYGEGVYFAVHSSYSVGYAKPDAAGNRLMYQVCVLVGVTTPTSSGIRALPYRSGIIPYDSGTDNANASARQMYVIFHDAQAYPEYLITF